MDIKKTDLNRARSGKRKGCESHRCTLESEDEQRHESACCDDGVYCALCTVHKCKAAAGGGMSWLDELLDGLDGAGRVMGGSGCGGAESLKT